MTAHYTFREFAEAKPERAEPVSFRDIVPEISSTTYASHGMYYYPARFIPHVVRWAIQRYTVPGDWIIDPFAGSGTVCVEALITNRNSLSLDLSPILEHLIAAKTFRLKSLQEVQSSKDSILQSKTWYTPEWSRISYWHPKEFMQILGKMWGGYWREPHPLTLIALLRTTRYFSYADETIPKLFKSKTKTAEVERMLSTDYRTELKNHFLRMLRQVCEASQSFARYYKGGIAEAKGRIDLLHYGFDKRKFRLLLTSPPYGIAHEYIRSVKLELAWLGYTDSEITNLLIKEIPYNSNPPEIEVRSEAFHRAFAKVKTPHAVRYCETYFKSILYVLGKVLARLEPDGIAAIFIGNATFSGVEFPFHEIFREHFESYGYNFERLLIDRIKARRLFKGRLNPSPNGIKSEYLLVLRNGNKPRNA